MEPTNRHPLECITNQSGLSMLECLIPFVDYPLKLPLALFIKFNEIRMIMNAFHSYESISSFGLNATTSSPTDMLCALTGMSPEMMNTILSMTSGEASGFASDLFSNLGAMGQGGPNMNGTNCGDTSQFAKGNNHSPNTHSFHHTSSLDDSIANIFAEYDMQQAENYIAEQADNFDTL